MEKKIIGGKMIEAKLKQLEEKLRALAEIKRSKWEYQNGVSVYRVKHTLMNSEALQKLCGVKNG